MPKILLEEGKMNDPGSTLADVVNGLSAGDSGVDDTDDSPDTQSLGMISPETKVLAVVMLAVAILIAAGSYFVR